VVRLFPDKLHHFCLLARDFLERFCRVIDGAR
jgi:hypothetical protein